jgi:hypothetical protein
MQIIDYQLVKINTGRGFLFFLEHETQWATFIWKEIRLRVFRLYGGHLQALRSG